jgi:choline dehydrogenase-like flavoprotein
MGTDSMAVVDARLRVHGIIGLRAIDASIMPIRYFWKYSSSNIHDW